MVLWASSSSQKWGELGSWAGWFNIRKLLKRGVSLQLIFLFSKCSHCVLGQDHSPLLWQYLRSLSSQTFHMCLVSLDSGNFWSEFAFHWDWLTVSSSRVLNTSILELLFRILQTENFYTFPFLLQEAYLWKSLTLSYGGSSLSFSCSSVCWVISLFFPAECLSSFFVLLEGSITR